MEKSHLERASARRRSLSTGVLLIVIVAVGTAPTWAANWYESYAEAENALAREDWDEAIRQINLALERKGDSSASARTYGVNFSEYFPYYILGLAYFNKGEFEAALQAFETEERLGAIEKADEAYAELERMRGQVEQAQQDAAAEEQQRTRQLIADNLSEAERLEQAGDLEGALSAVDTALSLEQQNPDAQAAKRRLLVAVATEQARLETDRRVASLLEQGRTQLAAEQFQEAASTFSRALNLKDDAEISGLLEQAQSSLRARIQAEQDAERQQQMIADGLARAGGLESEGKLVEALEQLQTVLVLDPDNQRASALQAQIIRTQAQREQERSRTDRVERLLADAESYLEAGEHERALTASNRVLAQDPGNQTAMSFLARAYREKNRALLSTGQRENFPPAVQFTSVADSELTLDGFRRFDPDATTDPDALETGDDAPWWLGMRVEVVKSPTYKLLGSSVDHSPVTFGVERERFDLEGSGDTDPVSTVPLETPPTTERRISDVVLTNFSLDERLAPGLTRFRVVATDEQGAKSSSTYAVLYLRPVHRSPLFFAGIALVVAACGAGIYARRVRSRNRLLARRFNPYVAGAPILQDEGYYGREDLMHRVMQTIHNNSILLYGERRIGKTSFQHRLKKRLTEISDPEYDFYPVYIDVQGTPEERFFATLAEEIFQELAPLLDGCEPSPSLHGEGDYQHRELVRDLRRVLAVLDERGPRTTKLVMLIDEVDELNNYDPRVNQRLRSLFMRNFSEYLVAVVSGVGIKKRWESEGSPWYNFFEEIEVKPFRREDAERLIEDPIKGIFKLENGVVDSIIEKTNCRPFLIQKLCIALVNRLHEEQRRSITLIDVEHVGRPKEA